MGTPRQFPNQHAEHDIVTGTSTGEGVDFGFNATYLRISNDGPRSLFLNLGSTQPSTGDGFEVTSGETVEMNVGPCRGIGLAKNSTSTGIGARVLALG